MLLGPTARAEKDGPASVKHTYLRSRVHLLGAVHRQGDLATLSTWCWALHHQVLCGDSLGSKEKGAWSVTAPATAKSRVLFFRATDRTRPSYISH